MNLFILHGLILLGFSIVMLPEVFGTEWSDSMLLMDPEIPLKKCRYSRDSGMLTSNCRNLELQDIPSTLRSDIEVLDFSVNRLRAVKKDTLSRFTSLKYLDLHDNFLRDIEEGAFDSLQDLRVLDLTQTLSGTFLKSLLTLPHLEKLYIENDLLTDSFFKTKVTSPLIIIHAPKNKLEKLPQLGPFPTLIRLNVSENKISRINVDDIAPYCRLTVLDVSENPITFDTSSCDCQYFNAWTKAHNITVIPIFKCSNNLQSDCSGKFKNSTMARFQECEEMIRIKYEIEKAKSTWILVVSCVSGSLVCIFLILYCIHRRNKKRHQKLKKAQQLAATNANTELLNGNLQEQT